MAKPPSTASSTSTNSVQTPSTTPQQPTSSHARRRSAPRYSSPQVKSSYGAPASESANLNPSPSQAAASAALRPNPAMYSDSTRGSIGGGGGGASDESDGESHQGESAAVRQARLKERKRNTTIGRNKINGSSLNNTSVNIATAIYQAEQARFGGATGGPSVSSYPANLSSSSFNTSTTSTSHKETHVSSAAASSSRRGPLPPAPMTQIQAAAASRSPDDDSLLEEERARRRRERTKSPVLDAIAGAARALSPVSYLLKPRVAQGGPFPDEDHDDDGAGYQSFSSFRAADRRSPGVQPPQDSSFLSANSAADLSSSSYLALGADRSQDSQASDYGFDEEERLMAEMEAKKARVLGSGGELRKVSGGQGNAGWFSGLAGFVVGTREDEPTDVTPKKKKGERRAAAADDGRPYEPPQIGESDDDDFSSDSFGEEDDDPDRPTKTTSVRRRPRISDDAKTYKYRPGDSASESDSSDGRGGKRRRRRKSGKVIAHGAEGMDPVVEGKKRRKKGGKGKATAGANGADESDEDEVVVVGEHRAEHSYDDSYEGGMDYDQRPSPREEEDSFIVRFHPGAAQTPPSAAAASRSSARQRTDGSTQFRASPPSWSSFLDRTADILLALLRAVLVAAIFLLNSLASAFAWLAQAPVQAARRLQRSLGLVDWRKISKPLGATVAIFLLASILGRRSPDRSPLKDSPSSWRVRLPSLGGGGGIRSPLSSHSLPPDSIEELLDRLAKIEGTLGAVSSQGHRSSRDVEALTAKLGGMERRLDISDRSMTSLDGRVGSLRTDFSSLQERVKEAERVAKQALEASKVAQAAADAIEEHLPARLAVKVNPKSKALEIDPAFWQAMKDVFVGRQDLPASISGEVSKQQATLRAGSQPSPPAFAAPVPPPSWQDFLAANEQALASWSDGQLARQSQSGAVISRADFLQVLRSELETVKTELDERAQESLQHKADEVLRRALAESSSYVDRVVRNAVAKLPVPKPVPAPPSARVDAPAGDDVTGQLSAMIDAALLKFSKDTLAMSDFALYSAGGRVIPSITSDTFEQPIPRWGGLLKPKVILGRPPATALVPDVNVGNCWPFAGSKGQLGIKLARRVHVSDITIEHAAREVSFDMAAAPRDIEVWGLVEGQANFDKVAEYQAARADEPQTSSLPPSPGYILLGSLSYDIDSPRHVQTFTVPQDIRDLGVDVGIVVVRINSNYGEDYTCLYRVRVHGEAAPDPVYETAA